MMAPLDPTILPLGSAESVLGFARVGGGGWPEWYRFLTIEGNNAFEIGNICDTCPFYFQRLEGAPETISPEELVEVLAAGPPPMAREWLEAVGKLLPIGDYLPFYAKVPLRLVRPGGPGDYFVEEQPATWGTGLLWGQGQDPKTEYYRGRVLPISPLDYGNRCIYEFVVPMFPHDKLDSERVAAFRDQVGSADAPTALAVSVLDVKGPVDFEEDVTPTVVQHSCLSHYLLDGHHKALAAASAETPLNVLSFLAVSQSVATEEEIFELVARLSEPNGEVPR